MGLDSHPLWKQGLKYYEFHVGQAGIHGERVWIGTLHDGTFTIFARSVEVLEADYPGAPKAAIQAALGDVHPQSL